MPCHYTMLRGAVSTARQTLNAMFDAPLGYESGHGAEFWLVVGSSLSSCRLQDACRDRILPVGFHFVCTVPASKSGTRVGFLLYIPHGAYGWLEILCLFCYGSDSIPTAVTATSQPKPLQHCRQSIYRIENPTNRQSTVAVLLYSALTPPPL